MPTYNENDNPMTPEISTSLKAYQKQVNTLIKQSKKYEEIETKKCKKLFGTVSKASNDVSKIYSAHLKKITNRIEDILSRLTKALKTQKRAVKNQRSVKEARFMPALEECIHQLTRMSGDIGEALSYTNTTYELQEKLSNKMVEVNGLFKEFQVYWETQIKNTYNPFNEKLKTANAALKTKSVHEETMSQLIDSVKISMEEKHNRHINKFKELDKAYGKGLAYARITLYKRFTKTNVPEMTNGLTDAKAEKIEGHDPQQQKVEIGKELSKLEQKQSPVAQLKEKIAKLDDITNISQPKYLRDIATQKMSAHNQVGKRTFYIMGILIGLEMVLNKISTDIQDSLKGCRRKIFTLEHRKLVLTGKIVQIILKILVNIAAAAGVAAGILGLLGKAVEVAATAMWIVNGAISALNEYSSPAFEAFEKSPNPQSGAGTEPKHLTEPSDTPKVGELSEALQERRKQLADKRNKPKSSEKEEKS